MKIKYESTIEEAIEAHLRLMALSKTLRKMKWEGLLFVPIIFIAVYFIFPGKVVFKISYAILTSAIFIPLYLSSYKRTIKKRIRKLLIESLGTDKPVPAEFEFTDDGLIFRRLGAEVKFRWNTPWEINEDEKILEFIFENKSIAVIPKRIFENE